jgi:hypothetical protein
MDSERDGSLRLQGSFGGESSHDELRTFCYPPTIHLPFQYTAATIKLANDRC